MEPQIVLYILYGLFALIILGAFLTGIRRGLKKSLYWFITSIIFFVLFFLTMNVASQNSYNQWIKPHMSNWLIDLFNMDAEIATNPAILDQVSIIGQMVLKIVYFIGLWVVCYFISWVLWVTVFKSLLLKPKRSKEEKQKAKEAAKARGKETKQEKEIRLLKEEQKQPKVKKRRLLGGMVGLVRGAIHSFMILCFLNGIIAILPEVERSQQTASTQDTNANLSIYDYLVEKVPGLNRVLDYIEVYQDSTLNKITKIKINGKTIDLMFTDAFLSGSYQTEEGKKVKLNLTREMKNLAVIATKAYDLTNGFDMASIDFYALTLEQQNITSSILKMMSEDSFLMGSIPAVIAFGLVQDDLSKELKDLGIDNQTFKGVNWANDLLTISKMVNDVYALSETYNLKEIDYYHLDLDLVDSIFTSLSNLTVLQPSMNIATNQLLKMEEIQDIIGETQLDFSDIIWSNEIVNISQIYKDFVAVGVDALLEDSKNENGKVNVLQALTSLSNDGHEAAQKLIDSIFNSVFVERVVPVALEYATAQIKDASIREMINFDVVGEDGWENELSTVFQLIKEMSKGGQEPFSTFNFQMIKNISVDTLLKSKLLEDASITLLVNSANGQGPLNDSIAKYIGLPDALLDKNNPAWKDRQGVAGERIDGELRKTLTPLKEILNQIEDFDDVLGSLPEMIQVVDSSITDSNVLYYSLNKAVPVLLGTDVITIPSSAYEENGLIAKEELNALFTSLKMVSFNHLIGTKLVDEELEDGTTTQKEIHVFVDNTDAVMETMMEIQDAETFFQSSILQSTASYFIQEYAGEVIVLPEGTYTNQTVVKGESEETLTISMIHQKDLASLLQSLGSLKDENGNLISFTTLQDEPEQIINYLSVETAQKVFISSNTETYSSILHATISKYLIEYDTDGTILIPTAAYENAQLIQGKEIVNLIQSIKKLEIDDFNQVKEDPMSLMHKVDQKMAEELFLKENTETYSSILHATMSKYLLEPPSADQEKVMIIPNSVVTLANDQEKASFVDGQEIVHLIQALKGIGIEEIDFETFTLDDLMIQDIYAQKEVINNSLILRASTTAYIEKANIEIPNSAYAYQDSTSSYVTTDEFNAFMDIVYSLFDVENQPDLTLKTLKTLKLSDFTIDQIYQSKDSLSSSKIVRNMVTKEMINALGNTSLPADSLDTENMITEEEVQNLIESLKILEIQDLTTIEVNNLTLDVLKKNDYAILNSIIIWDKISEEIKGIDALVIPSDVQETIQGQQRIKKDEIKKIFTSLETLEIQTIASIDVDSLVQTALSDSFDESKIRTMLDSTIIEKTASKNIKDNYNMGASIFKLPENQKVSNSIGESITIDYVSNDIDKEEIVSLLLSAKTLGFRNMEVTEFSFDEFLSRNLSDEDVQTILSSKIISYNLGIQIADENIEGGIFNGLLVLPENPVWFSHLMIGEELIEGDVYPFVWSLNKIYTDTTLKGLFDELTTTDSSSTTGLLSKEDSVYASLANYASNGRILLGTIPSIANKFLNQYKGGLIPTDTITIPTNEGEDYWRGNTGDIKDGELYKFMIGMNRIYNYDKYTSEETLANAIKEICQSAILVEPFKENVLFNEATLAILNAYITANNLEPLPTKEEVQTKEELHAYIDRFVQVFFKATTNIPSI